jgi:hypothetical protein
MQRGGAHRREVAMQTRKQRNTDPWISSAARGLSMHHTQGASAAEAEAASRGSPSCVTLRGGL